MSRHWTDIANLPRLAEMLPAVGLIMILAGCAATNPGAPGEGVNAGFPAGATSRYERALGFMDAGEDERAVAAFERIAEAYPAYAGPHVNLGIIHGRNGRPDAALRELQRAVDVCSGCAAAYNQLGIVQRQQGRFTEAEQAYLAAIEANPDYALAYFNLGVLYELYQGRLELALRYYEAYKLRRRPEVIERKDVVDTWIIDLRRRVGAPGQNAEAAS
ncbi:MAG: tetratricopeptide repeat protein [Gammaproteobacteria bacterium]